MAELFDLAWTLVEGVLGFCRGNDTPLGRYRLAFETLDVDDDPHLMAPISRLDGDAVKRRSLDHGAEPVTGGIERLAVQPTEDHAVGAGGDVYAAYDEGFDLVHVETLVDPRHQKRFRALGLRADLAGLTGAHRRGVGNEREHPERCLRERVCSGWAPGADPDVRFNLKLFESLFGVRQ